MRILKGSALITLLVLLACSAASPVEIEPKLNSDSDDPTPNIEATVEARLQEERTTNATIKSVVIGTKAPTQQPTRAPAAPASSSARVDVVDTVGNILDLYDGNEFAADATLTGKWVEMRGKVERVESVDGKIEVNLIGSQDMFRMNNLVCKVGVDQTDKAVGLRQNDVIVVTGKLLGITGFSNVVAEPCQLSDPYGKLFATPIPTAPASSSARVDVVDTVGNILDLYDGNEFAADATLTGKWVEMRGKVERVESVDGKIEVNLIGSQDMFRMNNLVCKVGLDQTDEAMSLRKDDVVIVTGKLLGITGFSNVVAEPCLLPSDRLNVPNATDGLGGNVSLYGNTVYFHPPVTKNKAQQYIESLHSRGILTSVTTKAWQLRMVNGVYEVRAGRWNDEEMRYFTDDELAGWNAWYEGDLQVQSNFSDVVCVRQDEDFDGVTTQLVIVYSATDLSIPLFDYILKRIKCER